MGPTAKGWAAWTAAVVVPFGAAAAFVPGHGLGWQTPKTICAALTCAGVTPAPQGSYGVLGARASGTAAPLCPARPDWRDRLRLWPRCP
jgi:hypothetical protein